MQFPALSKKVTVISVELLTAQNRIWVAYLRQFTEANAKARHGFGFAQMVFLGYVSSYPGHLQLRN